MLSSLTINIEIGPILLCIRTAAVAATAAIFRRLLWRWFIGTYVCTYIIYVLIYTYIHIGTYV